MSRNTIIILCIAAALLAVPVIARYARPAAGEAPQNQASGGAAPGASSGSLPATPPGTPGIVSMNPGNGATGVSPALKEIRVTFDAPMGGGFSWTGGGESFPGAPGMKPYWTPDRKTCVLPVALRPNGSYRLGINSPSHRNFKSESGVPLSPVVWTFSTGN